MVQLIDNSKPKSPCHGCVPPDRYVGCHSVCPDFKRYEYEREIASMQLKKRKFDDNEYTEYKVAKKYRK